MSKKNKQQVPKVRFTGFSDSWLQGKLRDGVFRLIGGVSISPSDYFEEGCPTVPKGAVNVSGVADLSGIKYVSESFFQNNNKAVVSEGDLITCLRDLVPSGPNLARIVKIPVSKQEYKYLMPQGVYALKLRNNLIYSFLVNFSNTDGFRNIVFREKNGTTQVHIRNDDFLDIKIIYPSTNEQTQIGNFFQQLDKLIELQTRAVESAETYKKAMLQKMFPLKGEKVPRVRFEGFSGDWEERKVGDIFTATRGQVLAATKVSPIKVDSYQYPVYSSQTKDNGLLGYYDSFLFENAITWTTDGAHAGTVNYRKEKFYSTNVNGVLLSDAGFANPTISEILNSVAFKYVSRVGNPKLMNNIMVDIPIVIPPLLEEQIIIGNYIQKLDQNIESEKKKLEQYQTMKRAILQRMFV